MTQIVRTFEADTYSDVYNYFCSLYPELEDDVIGYTGKCFTDMSRSVEIRLNNGLKILFDINKYGEIEPTHGEFNAFRTLLIPNLED